MSDQAIKNPRIQQGWLRLILFGCCLGLITLLVAVPTVMLVAGISKDDLMSNPVRTLSGLFTGNYLWLIIVLEAAVSLITVCGFRLLVDRKGLLGLGLGLDGYGAEAITGLLLGPALLGLSSLLMLFSGHLEWTDIIWDGSQLFVSLGLMMLIAFSEELIFRGYILGNLLDTFAAGPDKSISTNNKYIALAISAFLFSAFHATNPGIHTLAFLNLFFCGLLFGVNYIYTRNLWFSFLLHFSWNFFQGPLLGFRVSGLSLPSVLQTETKGDLFITGGDFGLEGSILITAITFAAFIILTWAFGRKYRSS
jgi:uncharacterized protein